MLKKGAFYKCKKLFSGDDDENREIELWNKNADHVEVQEYMLHEHMIETLNAQTIKIAVRDWTRDPKAAEEKYGHISDWVTKEVVSMKVLFKDQMFFNEDISNWDTSNVTSMQGMFSGCKAFDCDLSLWNTSSIPVKPKRHKENDRMTNKEKINFEKKTRIAENATADMFHKDTKLEFMPRMLWTDEMLRIDAENPLYYPSKNGQLNKVKALVLEDEEEGEDEVRRSEKRGARSEKRGARSEERGAKSEG